MPYRRKDSQIWWASYTDPSGKRVRRSTETTNRREAEALEAKWKLESYRAKQWDEEPELTFEEVMVSYLRASHQKRSAATDRYHAAQLRESFAGKIMNRLSGADISLHIRRRQADGVSNTTINRELALLSSAIGQWNLDWDAALPNPVRGRKLKEPEGRLRWLTRDEAEKLIAKARQSKQAWHLAPLLILALNTGMRREEMFGLEWSRVDLERGLLYLADKHTKQGKRRTVPLNQTAAAALRSCAEYRDAHCPNSQWVFCRKDGSRMRSSSTGFARACKDVGISDFRFHDLRHTCAAWLVQAGVPLTEVRDVLGHSTIKMTERYAHLAPENIRNAVAVLDLESRFSHGAKSTKNEDAHKDAVSY